MTTGVCSGTFLAGGQHLLSQHAALNPTAPRPPSVPLLHALPPSHCATDVIVGDGVKHAFCNDKWLVVTASGEPGVFTANLNDVPYPPKESQEHHDDIGTGSASEPRRAPRWHVLPIVHEELRDQV